MKLRSAIEDEVTKRRLNFTGYLQDLLEQLEDIHAAIPDADDWWMATDWDHGEAWRVKVKDSAYMVCHMVEELQEMTPAAENMMGIKMLLSRSKNVVVEAKSKEMVDKMTGIKEKLKELLNESVKFDLAEIRERLQAQAVEAGTLGREEDVEKILAQLSGAGHTSSEEPIILLIRGDEGVGKATVAAMVFDSDQFKIYSRVWINLCGMLELHEIGKYIISQVSSDGSEEDMSRYGSSKDDMDHITYRLHEVLNGRKVLVVLHELWEDVDGWKALKDMLSIGGMNNSAEVIVVATVRTTYIEDTVAMQIFGVQPYSLDPLSEEMCGEIIKQAVVSSQDISADKEALERMAAELAKLCGGLPLAAKLFGGVQLFKQYRELPELLVSQVFTHRGPVDTSLELSYRCLPPDLKLCFTYCAFLGTGRSFLKEDLIHQWMALGLIEPSSEAFSSTQLAEQYIRRLLDMSLLQTAKLSWISANDDKCAIWFTMHSKIHEFTSYSIREDLGVLDSEGRVSSRAESYCYALVADFNHRPLKSMLPDQKIRALRCLGCSKLKLRDDSFSFARCLRVLELCMSTTRTLPGSICELKHLGYLKLSGWSGLVTLPESIGNLTNLLHLHLSSCSELVNLPESFGKLINLVHINLSGCSKLAYLPESFRKLTRLVRVDLSGSSSLEHLPKSLGKLINCVHLNLSGCLALVNLPESLGNLTKLDHINLSGCPKLVNLPGSFGKLASLTHINLSGCPGLVSLPGSFGKLTDLTHINLSGCSGLDELPQSFGKLTSLVHMNLSGCSGLVTLPGSFGDLKNLLHVNLSSCHGLSELPASFGRLKKLVHLDLSFWSSFEGVQTALGGLTNLQHLNLSHPCCYRVDYPCFNGLKEVLGKLIRLKHLNLSMFLNPIFCNQSEVENSEYINFISGFSRLEYLDLSHSIFLRDLPESLGYLRSLHTVDLSGCIRFKKVEKWMAEGNSMKSIVFRNLVSYQFVVGTDNVINNYVQLANVRCTELEITCLEKMKCAAQARRIRLAEKQNLEKLKLCWTLDSERSSVEDKTLLGELVPPHSTKGLELHGYSSTCFPDWLKIKSSISSLNLVDVTLEDITSCSHLPPLGLLPHLQRVVLRRMGGITKIDVGDLTGDNRAAFHRLSEFIIDDMCSLEEFITTYRNGGEELVFSANDKVEVRRCPNMSFVPLPPRARRLVISDCNVLMVCWHNRAGTHGFQGPSCICSPVTQVTELVVESCRVYPSHWCLLNHLPALHSLTIENCSNLLVNSGEVAWVVSSIIQTLCFSRCDRMTILPEYLGGLSSLRELQIQSCGRFSYFPDSIKCLTSLQKLTIKRCNYICSLPPSIGELTNLKDLYILDCHSLKCWCERDDESKKALGHIRPKYEENPNIEPRQQHTEIEEDDPEQSD
uniref:Uncharacterized protein n=1 Tax=Avena sativa TaxID=4498 RepID=A0ACD6AG64_AVESA